MSNQTLFYAFGIALVLLALGTSAIGIRKQDFPSKGAFRGGALLFAVLVAVTATFAVLNAHDEQQKRQAEQAQESAAQ
jgi:hypothetical protein